MYLVKFELKALTSITSLSTVYNFCILSNDSTYTRKKAINYCYLQMSYNIMLDVHILHNVHTGVHTGEFSVDCKDLLMVL